MRAAAAALLLLAACGAPAPPDAAAPAPGLRLVPAQGGLEVSGSGGRQIGFGRAAEGALASALAVTGGAAQTSPCGGGRSAARLPGGLVMVFGEGRFLGWASEGGAAGAACA